MKLSELRKGESGIILDVEMNVAGSRLMEMGVTPGVRVIILNKALFGDPISVQLPGSTIVLRKKEANLVIIQKTGN